MEQTRLTPPMVGLIGMAMDLQMPKNKTKAQTSIIPTRMAMASPMVGKLIMD